MTLVKETRLAVSCVIVVTLKRHSSGQRPRIRRKLCREIDLELRITPTRVRRSEYGREVFLAAAGCYSRHRGYNPVCHILGTLNSDRG